MRPTRWRGAVLFVLCVLPVVEAQLAPTGWVSFDPVRTVRPRPGDPPAVLETAASQRMIVGPGLAATINPQTGALNDIYTGEVVDPEALPGYDPIRHSLFDPNTGLLNDPNLGVILEPNLGTFVDLTVPGMYVRRVTTDAGALAIMSRAVEFHRVSIPHCGTLREVGAPELPVLGRMVEVPHGARVSVEVIRSRVPPRTIGGYTIYPVQPSRERQQDPNEPPFVIDWNRYDKNEDYPAEAAKITGEGIIRGQRFVFLEIHPVQYNPVTKQTTAHYSVEVALKYDLPDANQPVNPKQAAASQPMSAAAAPGCDYLIVTPEPFYQPADPGNGIVKLAAWKRRKGYLTQVVTLPEIPRRDAASEVTAMDIRDYLENAYRTWQPAPMYVLLVGDVRDDEGRTVLPTNYSATYSPKGAVATDLYYATLDGDDYLPDLYVGRLSVDTIEQADAVIEKLLAYETRPPRLSRSRGPAEPPRVGKPIKTSHYYNDVALVQLFEDTDWDGREDATFRIIESAEEISTYLNTAGYLCHLIYSQSGGTSPGPQWYEDGGPLPAYLAFPFFPWVGGTNDILATVGKGCFLVSYNGHGSPTAWSRPTFDTDNVAVLANDVNTPVVLSLACKTGWFDNELTVPSAVNTTECFCEELLRRQGGGAVAVIGSSRSSYEDNDYLILGMFGAIWPDSIPALAVNLPGAPATGPWDRMGQINTYGKLFLRTNFHRPTMTPLHFELYNLFGDPEMRLWTCEPGELAIRQALSARGQEVEVYVTDETGVAVAGATVVLTRADTEVVLRQETDVLGYASFVVDERIPYDLTVTAPNYRPYMDRTQRR